MILYLVYEDGDGHEYLIPKDEFDNVLDRIEDLEFELEQTDDLEMLEDYIGEILDRFERLEGQEFYVVLPKDLKE